jgi:hypothetical protein
MTAVTTTGSASRAIHRVRRLLMLAVPVTAVALPSLLALAGGARWWHYIAAEQTPMTWFQSVVLVLAGAAALLLSLLARCGREAGSAPTWTLVGLGFWVLALDERFAVHERIRDRVLAPRDIRLPLADWIGPGDFLLLIVAALGLLVLRRVLSGLGPDRAARTIFVVGVVLAAVAVGMDSVDPARLSLAAERLEQTLEECVELAAGMCFAAALVLRAVGLLDRPAPDAEVPAPGGSWPGDVGQVPVER